MFLHVIMFFFVFVEFVAKLYDDKNDDKCVTKNASATMHTSDTKITRSTQDTIIYENLFFFQRAESKKAIPSCPRERHALSVKFFELTKMEDQIHQ